MPAPQPAITGGGLPTDILSGRCRAGSRSHLPSPLLVLTSSCPLEDNPQGTFQGSWMGKKELANETSHALSLDLSRDSPEQQEPPSSSTWPISACLLIILMITAVLAAAAHPVGGAPRRQHRKTLGKSGQQLDHRGLTSC